MTDVVPGSTTAGLEATPAIGLLRQALTIQLADTINARAAHVQLDVDLGGAHVAASLAEEIANLSAALRDVCTMPQPPAAPMLDVPGLATVLWTRMNEAGQPTTACDVAVTALREILGAPA